MGGQDNFTEGFRKTKGYRYINKENHIDICQVENPLVRMTLYNHNYIINTMEPPRKIECINNYIDEEQ